MAADYNNTTGTELEILQKIEKAFYRNNPGAVKRNTSASLDWFRNYVGKAHNKIGTGVMFRDRDTWKTKMTFGKMYFFEYLAKHRATLPIWDRYPLIFPFSAYKAKDGVEIIVGLNMHYLPPVLRMAAFKALLKFRNEKRYRGKTKLKLEWEVLKALSESKYFKHAVHSYRADHFKSVFVEVPAPAWELALFLPVARWQKGTASEAWNIKG